MVEPISHAVASITFTRVTAATGSARSGSCGATACGVCDDGHARGGAHASPENFQAFLELGGDQMRHKMEAAVNNQVRNVLMKIPLFADVADAFLELVCERVRFREASSGETIVEQGDESTELLVIASGTASESLEYLELPGGERFSLGSLTVPSPPGDDAGANAACLAGGAPAGVVVGHLGDSDCRLPRSCSVGRPSRTRSLRQAHACSSPLMQTT